MKKITFIICIALLASCKKKKETVAEPPAPQPVVYTISLKVDGAQKQCNSCYSASKSGNSRSSNFYLSGSSERIYFGCSAVPAIGTYTLVKYGEPSLIYIKDNTYYRATNGILNITRIDTSQYGVINNIGATFHFNTDTTNNVFFNITEGNINLKN